MDKKFDVIIIGGGPAGMTAGLYALRSNLKTLLIEKMGCGGQTAIADWIENYPGFVEGISGFDLSQKFEEHMTKFGINKVNDEVTEITVPGSLDKHFNVKTVSGNYECSSIIVSSGANYKKLNIPKEIAMIGKGVSYCATCDGPFFRNKELIVIGGGNSAIQEAIYLTKFASKVTVIHRRDKLRADKIIQDRAFANNKITFIWDSVVTEIIGQDMVEGAMIKNVKTSETLKLPAQGVFIFAGLTPNTSFLKNLSITDENGYVIADENMATSVKGVFACGDVRRKLLRQVITAAGEGATAAFAANQYIENLENH